MESGMKSCQTSLTQAFHGRMHIRGLPHFSLFNTKLDTQQWGYFTHGKHFIRESHKNMGPVNIWPNSEGN